MRKIYQNIILTILLLFIILVISFINNSLHERAHIVEAKKLNIKLNPLEFQYSPLSNNWGKANVQVSTKEDCERFNNLSLEEKQQITHAGVIQEFKFLALVFVVINLLSFKYYKLLWKTNRYALTLLLALNLLPLIILYVSLSSNVFTYNPDADWNILTLDCNSLRLNQNP